MGFPHSMLACVCWHLLVCVMFRQLCWLHFMGVASLTFQFHNKLPSPLTPAIPSPSLSTMIFVLRCIVDVQNGLCNSAF